MQGKVNVPSDACDIGFVSQRQPALGQGLVVLTILSPLLVSDTLTLQLPPQSLICILKLNCVGRLGRT